MIALPSRADPDLNADSDPMPHPRLFLVAFLLAACAPAQAPEAPEAPITLTPAWVVMGDEDGILDTDVEQPTSVESAEFSPDESLIASVAKGDDSIRLWRADDGTEVWKIYADDETESITFTKDGRFVVTGGEDRLVRALRVEDGAVVQTLEHPASIEGLRFSPDGTRLATGNEAGLVTIWDTSADDPADWPRTPLTTGIQGPDQDHPAAPAPEGTHADINQVDWTADGRLVVTAGRNGVVKLWNVRAMDGTEGGGLVRTFRGHTNSIKSVRLSRDGRLVAAGAQQSPDGAARVWDVETGELVAELLHPNVRIMETVEFTPDGRFLLIGGTEHTERGSGELYVYRVADFAASRTPAPVLTVPVHHQEYLHFTRDGSRLVSSHQDGSLRVWTIDT